MVLLDFGSKNSIASRAARTYGFEVKRKKNYDKDTELNVLQKWLGFLGEIFDIVPKILSFDVLEEMATKSKIIEVINKTDQKLWICLK